MPLLRYEMLQHQISGVHTIDPILHLVNSHPWALCSESVSRDIGKCKLGAVLKMRLDLTEGEPLDVETKLLAEAWNGFRLFQLTSLDQHAFLFRPLPVMEINIESVNFSENQGGTFEVSATVMEGNSSKRQEFSVKVPEMSTVHQAEHIIREAAVEYLYEYRTSQSQTHFACFVNQFQYVKAGCSALHSLLHRKAQLMKGPPKVKSPKRTAAKKHVAKKRAAKGIKGPAGPLATEK